MRLKTGLRRIAGALLAGWLAAAAGAQECGGPEAPCSVAAGNYHALLPATEPVGMILWLHGSGGSGAAEIANAGLVGPILAAGYAFVAPNGVDWPERDVATDWGVNDGFNWRRNDIAFLVSVIADATTRFGLPPDRVIVAGFSRGGSMAWDFACTRPDAVIGVAAVAGGFWEPMVTKCAGPTDLFHTHGFTDDMVPIEGQEGVVGNYFFQQGNLMKGLDVWRKADGCMGAANVSLAAAGDWEKRWTSCKHGSIILWLHPGGHMIPPGWVGRMLAWAQGLGH